MITAGEIRRAKGKAVGGKKDRCRKGKSCSATCISGWKACLVELPDRLIAPIRKLGEKVKGLGSPDRRELKGKREKFDKVIMKKLEKRLNDIVESGNAKEYKRVMKAFPKIQDTSKRLKSRYNVEGLRNRFLEDWKMARLEGAKIVLKREILKSIEANDRARYDKLKAKLVKLEGPSRRGEMWDNYQGLAHFAVRLGKSDIMNTREGVKNLKVSYSAGAGFQLLMITSDILGNKVSVNVTPSSLSFLVNDSYAASGKLSKLEQVAISREVRRQFQEVIKSIGEGTALAVIAEGSDGKGDMREKAYRAFGFSDPDDEGYMYGKVSNGKVVPSSGRYGVGNDRFSTTG